MQGRRRRTRRAELDGLVLRGGVTDHADRSAKERDSAEVCIRARHVISPSRICYGPSREHTSRPGCHTILSIILDTAFHLAVPETGTATLQPGSMDGASQAGG